MNLKELKDYIKSVIKEVMLDEMTTTASADGYNTPFAFSGNPKSKGNKRAAEQLGYKLVKEKEEKSLMEDVNVNVASELGQFKDQYNRTTKSLIANIIASLNKKFLGKGVRIMGKKNNPNIVVDNDYELLVKSINLEQVKNTFFLTFIDENGDSFYVNTKYQVVVLDRAPAPKSKQSNEKTNVNAQPSPQVQEPSPAEPAASNQQPAGDLSKQIKT